MQTHRTNFPYRGPRQSRKLIHLTKTAAFDAARLDALATTLQSGLETLTDPPLSEALHSTLEHLRLQLRFYRGEI